MAALARQKRLQASLGLPRCPALFVRAANDAEIAEIALPLVRGRWKKWTRDGVPNRLSNLSGRSAPTFIERNHVLREAADRRTEIKSSRCNLGFTGEQLFRGESIEQRLE